MFARLIYGGTTELRPYEEACVDALKKSLPDEGKAILSRQLTHLNLVQRSPDDRLVAFFDTTDKSCNTWKKEDFFLHSSGERPVSRVWLSPIDRSDGDEFIADVILYQGRLSAIQFNRSPQPLRRGAFVSKIKTLSNPMHHFEASLKPISLTDLTSGLREQLKRFSVADLCQPLPLEERQQILKGLPDDYIKLITESEGATIDGWQVHGLSQIRSIVQPDGNYYVLAENSERGAIGIVQDSKDPQLYFLNIDGDKPKPVGNSLFDVLDPERKWV